MRSSKREIRGKALEFSSGMLEILVCPVTLGLLRYDSVRCELVSDKALLAFPIRDGVPVMLVEEARVIK